MERKLSNIKERVLYISDYKNITREVFFKEIGMTYGSFKGGQKKSTLNSDAIDKILSIHTDIDANWLITGKGEMLKLEVKKLHNPPYLEKTENNPIPLYNIDAAAGLMSIFENDTQNILDTITIPDLPKCDGALHIRGDSMYPLLKSGDIAIFKHISNVDNILYGEMYIIDFSLDGDDYLVIKYINKSEKEGCIKLVSYNTHHQPKDIPVSSVRAIALVKASVRINTIV